jgi:hypothetical protein
MSGDQEATGYEVPLRWPPPCVLVVLADKVLTSPAYSIGEPDVPPQSPQQTPTLSAFPGSVPETPRQNQRSSFGENTPSWTPQFAEDYSVFNSTPGNLRGSQGRFVDFAPLTPFSLSAGTKRPLSAGRIAAEIATHATHFSSPPGVPLPPVEPSKRLQSSPGTSSTPFRQIHPKDPESPSQERSQKKARKDSSLQAGQHPGQTGTPPPTIRAGKRKLAPKLTPKMQNEQSFPQPDFTVTPQQPGMADMFCTTPTDMFGFPLAAPASAPVYNTRSFWDDAGMMEMNIDFAAANPELFQTPTRAGGRPMGSMDWGQASQMFQDVTVPEALPSTQPQINHVSKRERPLAPKIMMPPPSTSAPDAMFETTFAAPMEDPFGPAGRADGINPGIVFGHQQSATMDVAAFTRAEQQPSSSAPAAPRTKKTGAAQVPTLSAPPVRGDMRRSVSVKELAPKQVDRGHGGSSSKPSARPGLSRSVSESRGKRPPGRPALSSIAPASKIGLPPRRDSLGTRSAQQISRTSGRLSPSKGHHHRLSSLASIPEVSNLPRTRTSVKFTIDEHGRARAETTVINADVPKPPETRHQSARLSHDDTMQRQWESSDDDMSSVDEDPITIPSRNTSFALPDPVKPTRAHPFDRDEDESEAETVVNDATLPGNAANALRKVIETRQSRPSASSRPGSSSRRLSIPGSRGLGDGMPGQQYSSNKAISPTTLTDSSGLATPLTESRGHSVRCVCGRPEFDGDEFCVHW